MNSEQKKIWNDIDAMIDSLKLLNHKSQITVRKKSYDIIFESLSDYNKSSAKSRGYILYKDHKLVRANV